MTKENELTVFISSRLSVCSECKESLGKYAWIVLDGKENNEPRVLCLDCADLSHLDFLPTGDAALTRRSKKYSNLTAVVLKWSKTRKRYERQGLLVEPQAMDKAEQECLGDQEARNRRKERNAEKLAEQDQKYIEKFAKTIRQLYPGCPEGSENIIAQHACLKYSGRVGRSADAKNLEPESIELAVIAHIRHCYTDYDKLLMKGYERSEARTAAWNKIDDILKQWKLRS